MNTNRRARRGSAVLAVAALSLSACGASKPVPSSGSAPKSTNSSSGVTSSNASKVPVTVWTLSSNSAEQAVFQKIVKTFNASHPGGDVSVDFIQNTPYKTKISLAMSAKSAPTIFYTWGGTLFDAWVKAGAVMPVSKALAADPSWKSSFLPNVWPLASYKGTAYGVPMGGPGIELMFENKAMLKHAGVAPSPATWTALMSDVRAVKKTGANPIALGGATEWPEMIWLQYLTLRYGGRKPFDAIAAGSRNAWSNPAVLKAAAACQALAKLGAFEPGYSAVHYGSGQTDVLMAANKGAFQAMGDWDYSQMLHYAPTFAKSANYASFSFPSVSGGKGNPADFVGEPAGYYGISKYASPAAQTEALAFEKYLSTSSTYNIGVLENYGNTPVDVKYAAHLKSETGGTELYHFFELAAKAPYLQDYWDQDLSAAVVSPMLTEIGELFDLTVTPKQFAKKLNSVLAANG
jgi:raffinose/stachyose/melibiose transport system substrate-binding protein